MSSEQYERDITEAGRRAARMRRGGDLSRVLWLLHEKSTWNLRIGERILDALTEIQTKLDEGVQVDLGPTNALLQEILAMLSLGEETDEVESLNLTLGEPEPNLP